MGLTDTVEAPRILPFLESALGLSHLSFFFFLNSEGFFFFNICKIVQPSSLSNSKSFINPKRNSLAVTAHPPPAAFCSHESAPVLMQFAG